jgi:hypothetical protein
MRPPTDLGEREVRQYLLYLDRLLAALESTAYRAIVMTAYGAVCASAST